MNKAAGETMRGVQTLPSEYLRLIGEIVVAWSVVEAKLKLIIFMMLDLPASKGRLAVRSARANEMVELIADLAMADGHHVTFADEASLAEIEGRRNKLVHGVWLTNELGDYFIQESSGRMPLPGHPGVRISKRLLPAAVPITTADLQHLLDRIRETVASTDGVALKIEALLQTSKRRRSEPLRREESPGRS